MPGSWAPSVGNAGARPWSHSRPGIMQLRRKKMERCLLEPAYPFLPPPLLPEPSLPWGQPGKQAWPFGRGSYQHGFHRKPFQVSRLSCLVPVWCQNGMPTSHHPFPPSAVPTTPSPWSSPENDVPPLPARGTVPGSSGDPAP